VVDRPQRHHAVDLAGAELLVGATGLLVEDADVPPEGPRARLQAHDVGHEAAWPRQLDRRHAVTRLARDLLERHHALLAALDRDPQRPARDAAQGEARALRLGVQAEEGLAARQGLALARAAGARDGHLAHEARPRHLDHQLPARVGRDLGRRGRRPDGVDLAEERRTELGLLLVAAQLEDRRLEGLAQLDPVGVALAVHQEGDLAVARVEDAEVRQVGATGREHLGRQDQPLQAGLFDEDLCLAREQALEGDRRDRGLRRQGGEAERESRERGEPGGARHPSSSVGRDTTKRW
jgi:hypothetical protein